jgi:hypothetical protein
MNLVKDLAPAAEEFANLEVADSDIWKSFSVGTHKTVESLALLGGRQTHPIIMAALRRFSDEELEKLLGRLVTLIVRYQVIGRGRTGRLEIQAAAISKAIWDKKIKTANIVWKEMLSMIPDDEEFLEDFSRYEETKAVRARWLLRELEMQAWRKANPSKAIQHSPISDPSMVNLEHILPKNPGIAWVNVTKADQEIVRDCVNRLGNLCLLDKPSNKKKGAQAFSDKQKMYKNSDFILTKSLSKNIGEWSRGAIETRQKKLAKIATSLWSL